MVPLAPIADPALVILALAQALGLKETAGTALLTTMKEWLSQKCLILVLDNLEHVIDCAPMLADLLDAALQVKVLATSRTLLHLTVEQEFPVLPLAFPDTHTHAALDQLAQVPAVALFCARATAADPAFALTAANAPAVAAICALLDGLPLAIELAAARMATLSPAALLARLDQRLAILTDGSPDLPARQQTLRRTLDWSYDLLAPDERTLFARLAVFVGGFRLEAAEAVCDPARDLAIDVWAGIATLMDHSLLRQQTDPDGEPRWTMLGTIRAYALEHLAASPPAHGSPAGAALLQQHAAYFLGLAENYEPKLKGAQQERWFALIHADHHNFRAALAWGSAQQDAEHINRLAGALAWFWYIRGYFHEGQTWLSQARAMGPASARSRAWVLRGLGAIKIAQGDHPAAAGCFEEGLALQRTLDDPGRTGVLLGSLAVAAAYQGRRANARYLIPIS